ncbi:hypothetical protein [Muricoccus aerilatus]|uniref:hypothetical protein n=1 Tax=Muricoccus aerilatus TaxID=452982 RepID=UPI0005C214F6
MLSNEACAGDVVWPGTPFRRFGFGAGELSLCPEAFLDHLVGCFSVEDALAAGVVSGVEALEQTLNWTWDQMVMPSPSLPTRPLNLSTIPFGRGE